MESKEGLGHGVTMKGDDVSQGFCVSARAENPSQPGGPTMAMTSAASNMTSPPSDVRKKRGRPRKYRPDGPVSTPLSPMPISASIPLAGDFPGWKQPRVKPYQTIKKAHKVEVEKLGKSCDRFAGLGGANFTPHVITVSAGEDVANKVLSFSQQDSRAICVLSASGSISNVTLRQPNSSGGTLTYEGRFEILSLCGSFMPNDNGIVKSRSGGMSVSLAGPDGRVLGGGLAGLLVAASPVQVVIGSFLAGHSQEHKPKKQRAAEPVTTITPAAISPTVQGGGYGTPKVNFAPPPSFHTDPLPPVNPMHNSRHLETENNMSSPEGESEDEYDDDDSPSHMEICG